MKINEFKKLNNKELADKLKELNKKLIDYKFEKASQSLKNVKAISNTKKDIARIKTLMIEKGK